MGNFQNQSIRIWILARCDGKGKCHLWAVSTDTMTVSEPAQGIFQDFGLSTNRRASFWVAFFGLKAKVNHARFFLD